MIFETIVKNIKEPHKRSLKTLLEQYKPRTLRILLTTFIGLFPTPLLLSQSNKAKYAD